MTPTGQYRYGGGFDQIALINPARLAGFIMDFRTDWFRK
jgi:hypothetical protein